MEVSVILVLWHISVIDISSRLEANIIIRSKLPNIDEIAEKCPETNWISVHISEQSTMQPSVTAVAVCMTAAAGGCDVVTLVITGHVLSAIVLRWLLRRGEAQPQRDTQQNELHQTQQAVRSLYFRLPIIAGETIPVRDIQESCDEQIVNDEALDDNQTHGDFDHHQLVHHTQSIALVI